jgi:hypothetical protein
MGDSARKAYRMATVKLLFRFSCHISKAGRVAEHATPDISKSDQHEFVDYHSLHRPTCNIRRTLREGCFKCVDALLCSGEATVFAVFENLRARDCLLKKTSGNLDWVNSVIQLALNTSKLDMILPCIPLG